MARKARLLLCPEEVSLHLSTCGSDSQQQSQPSHPPSRPTRKRRLPKCATRSMKLLHPLQPFLRLETMLADTPLFSPLDLCRVCSCCDRCRGRAHASHAVARTRPTGRSRALGRPSRASSRRSTRARAAPRRIRHTRPRRTRLPRPTPTAVRTSTVSSTGSQATCRDIKPTKSPASTRQ